MFAIYILTSVAVFIFTYYVWKRITFNLIANIPCGIVAILYIIFGDTYGFKPLNSNLFVYLSLFMLVGFFTEVVIVFMFRYNYNNIRPNVAFIRVPSFFVYGIALTSLLILFVAYSYAQKYGITSEDFEAKMASGLIGHGLIFLMVTPPFIYLSYKNKQISFKVFLFSVSLVFTCLFIKQVKSWIMIPMIYFILMYLYYNEINKRRFFLIGAISACLLILLFFSVYYIKAMLTNTLGESGDFLDQIYRHFLFYFFSGLGAFSEYLNNDITSNREWYVLITPIINVINYITGEPLINVINPLNYTINYELNNSSNVFTMFGTMWLYMGFGSLFFYTAIVALQSILYLKRSSILLGNIFWLISSFGSFSWFEYYYFHLAAYEAPIYVIILTCLFSAGKNEYKYAYNHP